MHRRLEFRVIFAQRNTHSLKSTIAIRWSNDAHFLPCFLDGDQHRNTVHHNRIDTSGVQIDKHFGKTFIRSHLQVAASPGPFIVCIPERYANSYIFKIIQAFDRRVFLHNDRAAGMVIGPDEIHGLLPFRGNGHGRDDGVIFFRQKTGNDPVERRGDDLHLYSHPLSQCLADGSVESDNLVLLVGKAEGRVLTAHCDTDFLGILDRLQIISMNNRSGK
ncbi:hypothetical protein D3C81_905140 [compost metagenome]